MPVDTSHVPGRRKLRFESFDDVLADVERLYAGPVRTLGNWSLPQICDHLAAALNGAIDGLPLRSPWYLRLIAPLIKRRFLTRPMPSGFKIPNQSAIQQVLVPRDDVDADAALERLRVAVARIQSETDRAPNVVFGRLTREEADQFHLRHAEMHLSFAAPAETTTAVREPSDQQGDGSAD